jgi:hypothetical protein
MVAQQRQCRRRILPEGERGLAVPWRRSVQGTQREGKRRMQLLGERKVMSGCSGGLKARLADHCLLRRLRRIDSCRNFGHKDGSSSLYKSGPQPIRDRRQVGRHRPCPLTGVSRLHGWPSALFVASGWDRLSISTDSARGDVRPRQLAAPPCVTADTHCAQQ